MCVFGGTTTRMSVDTYSLTTDGLRRRLKELFGSDERDERINAWKVHMFGERTCLLAHMFEPTRHRMPNLSRDPIVVAEPIQLEETLDEETALCFSAHRCHADDDVVLPARVFSAGTTRQEVREWCEGRFVHKVAPRFFGVARVGDALCCKAVCFSGVPIYKTSD